MAKDSLSPAEVKDMLLLACQRIIEAEPILTDADRALGDGDHGLGMQRGMEAATEALQAETFESAGAPLITVGKAMMSSMGGASGVVFGTLFKSGGRAIKEAGALDSAGLAAAIQAGTDGVQQRGGAKPGDKTMVDALAPAADKAKEVAGEPLPAAIEAIAAAAESGKEASKDMIATMGRAKTLGERSLGHPDPGAVSVTIIIDAMRDYILA